MAPLTMSVPVLGALTLAEPLSTLELVGLILLGLNAHIFGFALNDIIDAPLDRHVPARQRSPLVTGQLSLRQAWIFVLGQIPLALWLYYAISGGNLFGLGILMLSIGLSVIYNLGSKWGPLPRLVAELALAVSVGLLCLAGTLAQTTQLPPESSLYALALTLVLLLLNSIPSGLKDLKTDAAFGASSFVIALGSRVYEGDRMIIPKRVWGYSLSLQLSIGVCFIGLIYLWSLPWWLAALSGWLVVYGGLHLRLVLSTRSFRQLRYTWPLLNGYYNYLALALLVSGQMPLYLQLICGLLVVALLLVPLQLSLRLWRQRYQLFS
jgi:4-hydroxybenzoate polyprenyltransferase